MLIVLKGGKLVLKHKLHITMGAMLVTLKWDKLVLKHEPHLTVWATLVARAASVQWHSNMSYIGGTHT